MVSTHLATGDVINGGDHLVAYVFPDESTTEAFVAGVVSKTRPLDSENLFGEYIRWENMGAENFLDPETPSHVSVGADGSVWATGFNKHRLDVRKNATEHVKSQNEKRIKQEKFLKQNMHETKLWPLK